MKRRNLPLIIFGTIVTVLVFVLFIVQGWQFVKGNAGKPLTTLTPQGPFANSIQTLVSPVFAIAAVVFFGVLGAVLYIGFRFRDRGDEDSIDELPSQLHGKTVLEIGWTIIPALVLLVVALGTVVTLGSLNAAAKPDALHVKVEGQQWWWRFTYDADGDGSFDGPGDFHTANEMVIPAGREIVLSETSNDVIHSFWIPALNGKKDAVPGMTTEWKIQADNPGVYRGQCTEFCGLSHANMRMLVRAVPQAEFDEWKANQQRPAATPAGGSLAAAGEAVFKAQLCSSCHLIRGVNDDKVAGPQGVKAQLVPGVAPELTHFASRGTFAGSIFNRAYPNPEDKQNQPFGQTCSVSTGPEGNTSLPACPEANQPDAFDIEWGKGPGNPDNPANIGALKDWLRDPPKMKPMAPEPTDNPHANGLRRGMPNLKLSEEQIDQLVAYLNSLK